MQELTVSHTLKPGNIYCIHPTKAFLGIDRGIIRIVNIFDVPALDAKCLDEANLFIKSMVKSDTPKEELQQVTESVMDSPWVEYQYTSFLCCNPGEPLNKSLYLPSDIFTGSITFY